MNKMPEPGTPLNERETEVLVYASKGFTNRQIAGLILRSEHTVDDWMKRVLRKLDVSSRAEAAVCACKMGLPV